MQKKILAAAVAAAVTLTACGPDTPTEDQFRNSIVSQAAFDANNRDKVTAEKLQAQLKLMDPSVTGLDPTVVDGKPTVSIHRQTSDGAYESWTMPPEDYKRLVEQVSVNHAQYKDDDYSLGSVLAAGAVGMVAGSLLSNMMNSSNRVRIPDQNSLSNYRNGIRSIYNRETVAGQMKRYEKEREKERRSNGSYVSPYINNHNQPTSAGATGSRSFRPAPSQSSSSYSAASSSRSSSSGQAFSSGARGSVSSGG